MCSWCYRRPYCLRLNSSYLNYSKCHLFVMYFGWWLCYLNSESDLLRFVGLNYLVDFG